jgi:hypothetical protein
VVVAEVVADRREVVVGALDDGAAATPPSLLRAMPSSCVSGYSPESTKYASSTAAK